MLISSPGPPSFSPIRLSKLPPNALLTSELTFLWPQPRSRVMKQMPCGSSRGCMCWCPQTSSSLPDRWHCWHLSPAGLWMPCSHNQGSLFLPLPHINHFCMGNRVNLLDPLRTPLNFNAESFLHVLWYISVSLGLSHWIAHLIGP